MNRARGTEDEQVADAIAQYLADPRCGVSDRQARMIASRWQGGQATALYSFVSCGAISAELTDEIQGELTDRSVYEQKYYELRALLAYAVRRGRRGPQTGWSQLSW